MKLVETTELKWEKLESEVQYSGFDYIQRQVEKSAKRKLQFFLDSLTDEEWSVVEKELEYL